ncbi:DNRLRE domain-containing protein [Sorangium sp. So ce394]|uniref:DNRLRE domain-containing protein n=1 Tax=Sorangium sp. So ce394 TaxID=3133310 RepID=UPI003F5BA010
MRTLAVVRLATSVLLPAACVQPTGIGSREEGGEERSAIIGTGSRADNTHAAVVALFDKEGGLCSGTIVRRSADGDKVHVLTAAHCCEDSPGLVAALIGPDIREPSRRLVLPVEGFQRHPCHNGLSHDYDICVVTARGAGALRITPIPLASWPDGLEVGSAVTVVGYGSTPATNTSRRNAEAWISEVAPLTIAIDQTNGRGGLCSGDSGGPALIRQDGGELVVGVGSFAPGGLCDVVGGLGRAAFPGIREEFLDKELAGEKSALQALVIQRRGITPGRVHDTYIASDRPGRSFGESVDLLVGTPPGTDAIRSALLRFDLSELPQGAMLLTARIGLSLESTSGPGVISVHRVVKDWDESASWASFEKDGFEPTPIAVSGNATATVKTYRGISFDVTGLVADWLGGKADNYGILLREDDGEQTRLLASEINPRPRESVVRPWMHICYLPGPPG